MFTALFGKTIKVAFLQQKEGIFRCKGKIVRRAYYRCAEAITALLLLFSFDRIVKYKK